MDIKTSTQPSASDLAEQIRKEADEFNANCQKISWQLVQFAEALPMLRQSKVRQGGFKFLKGYLVDYGKSNRKADQKEIDVSQPIDAEIPFVEESLSDYVSHISLWVAGVNFLKKHFGKEADEEISQSLNTIAGLFPEAAKVYSQAQTSFKREEKGGLKFSLMRYLDNSRNAAPSLHVEIAAYTYSSLTDIIDRHAKEPDKLYEPIKQVLFQRAVRILESVLLVKQHMVLDVALGLAALSDKESSFTRERALKMIEAMFEENKHGMSKTIVSDIRQTIKTTYSEVASKITANPEASPSQAIVEYLMWFSKNKNTKID